MINKKLTLSIFTALVLFTLILHNVLAQGVNDEGIPSEVEGITNASDKIVDIGQNLTKEDYLKQEWQKILLNNTVISKLDAAFRKGNIVFKVLFGVDYSLSLTLVFIITLWVFTMLIVKDSTKKGLGIFEAAAWVLGIVSAVALSQLKIIPRISAFLVKLIFYQEAGWARFIIFVVVVGIIVVLFYLKALLSGTLEANRKKKLESETEQHQKEIKVFNESLKKGRNL